MNTEAVACKFEEELLTLLFTRQRRQWENYVAGASHDLSVDDDLLFKCVTEAPLPTANDRHAEVVRHAVARTRVDTHPRVASIRNRLDRLYTDSVAGGARATTEGRVALGNAMRRDVLDLMAVRNAESQAAGYSSYPALVLETEELDIDVVSSTLECYIGKHADEVGKLVKEHRIALATWYVDIERIASIHCETSGSANTMAAELLKTMGITDALPAIRITVAENGLSGYVAPLAVPGDIRMKVKPVTTLQRWLTLHHELGHAVGHALNAQSGIFTTWTAIHDETLAILMENLALQFAADEIDMQPARDVALLATMECAVSAAFELDLWHDPAHAEDLFHHYYTRLGVDVSSPEIWAADCFRSLDPVYKHNYVLGHVYAIRIVQFLEAHYPGVPAHWGSWLREHIYGPGRRIRLADKLTAVDAGIS